MTRIDSERVEAGLVDQKQKGVTLKEQLLAIDEGRFTRIVNALDGIQDECAKCSHFRPELPPGQGYRCRVLGSCPAATLHPDAQSYWRWKLGWQTKEEHLRFMGLL